LTLHYLYGNLPKALIDAHLYMHIPSGLPQLPPDASHPASSTAPLPISNRYWKLLEIAVTPTKHSPGLISNRYKNTFFRAAWGRHSCLRSHNLYAMISARTSLSGRHATFASVTAGQRSTLTRQPLTFPCSANAISNRHWMRLEIAATQTKQSIGITSNRHKITLYRARPTLDFPHRIR
jgi:hypothetical protein